MSTEVQDKVYRFDLLKWIVVAALVSVAVGINIFYAEQPLGYRVAGIVAVALVAIFVAMQTEKGAQLFDLLVEARKELRKVVWPTAQERTQTTVIVLIAVALMSLILWALDSILGWLASMILG
jgi:preprotein translocase subunit SecE